MPYTISLNSKIKLIVGLGNPGKEYNLTRHNIGYMAIDAFAKANNFNPFKENTKFKAYISEQSLGNARVILLKPQTFMNLSGQSVQSIRHYFDIKNSNCVVIHDELNIRFGQIRTRIGGQSAGHNGVKSIIDNIGADFGRIRIGIKNDYSKQAEDSEFVLGKFDKIEQEQLPKIVQEVSGIITEYVFGDNLPADTRKIFIE